VARVSRSSTTVDWSAAKPAVQLGGHGLIGALRSTLIRLLTHGWSPGLHIM